ncbi:4Fe-4S dicluster domain-containing protein [Hungatella hathewayi]|uniref:4Fe-4S dicluster domain-containing protein n=2 Tax=Lachnospirales TaxID=3085636 RepID=A0A3E2WXY3_9FIRM|nr:4Fe-4S dicluster domain-containing protein [Hungatella hathewayi]GKH33351.1 oxidoreductase [Faecalicatena contorta]
MIMEKLEKVYTDVSRCKGCGYCIEACPRHAVSVSDFINANGYNSIQVDESKCIVCGICYKVCPDYVFEIR